MEKQDLINTLRCDVAGTCVGQKSRNAARLLTRRFDNALRPVGLTGSQYSMLAVIALTQDKTHTELAAHMALDRTTLIRNLKPLEREGWVVVSDEGYRRARSVDITDLGVAKLSEALPLWREIQETIKKELGEEAWCSVHHAMEALGTLT